MVKILVRKHFKRKNSSTFFLVYPPSAFYSSLFLVLAQLITMEIKSSLVRYESKSNVALPQQPYMNCSSNSFVSERSVG